jgi:hypothetical protein
MIIDTAAYFPFRLEKLAELFCPELPKLRPPEGLGSKKFTIKDKDFIEYAMRDAEIAYYVGKQIATMHEEFNVPLCVSAPHLASRVFRKHFMDKTILLPPKKIVYSALASYHGGKNNLTAPKGFYKNVYALDIRSAYPFAMAQFPSFTNKDLYHGLSGTGNPEKELPPYGIYKISGKAKECRYPILYNHGFKPVFGDFEHVWTTGFELNEAMRAKEIELLNVEGYYYDADKDNEPSAFKKFVDHFFKLKDSAPDEIHRVFYKLILNSLYGKFIQTRSTSTMLDLSYEIDTKTLTMETDLVAGGLFNPFIATLITGHTRAYIHRLEHQYNALHTSTDGIFTQTKPMEKDGLGGLSIEAHGDLLLFRNKLYIIYAPIEKTDRHNKNLIRSSIFSGKKVVKYALHGFHGKLAVLEKMYQKGVKEYDYIKCNKLRESLRRGLQVNKFESRTSKLNV